MILVFNVEKTKILPYSIIFMKYFLLAIPLFFCQNLSAQHNVQDYPITPVGFEKVKLIEGFWKDRVDTVTRVTIPYAFAKCEETGRIDNFKKAGGLMPGKFRGKFGFDDSDVYKIIEGAAYSLSTNPNSGLHAYTDSVVSYIAAAQEADGYLYTAWSLKANDYNKFTCCTYNNTGRFYGVGSSHELYNAGHMYEAAVAHFYATGQKNFLDIATKNADLIYDFAINHNFGFYPGHQEIELGLVKLYRATGNKKYLELAKIFLERRGHAPLKNGKSTGFGAYSQDHIPVTEQTEAVGHSVRAGYMYAAMADVAAITGDKEFLNAIDKIWENIVTKKMYITGGLGAAHGIEGFDKDYVLPNDAYAETCAAIANVYWNHRMFLLHGDAKYIDVLERSLYNGVLPGLSLDGGKFFYPNPLVFDGKANFNQGANCRSDWFDCSCCPSNLSRFIPSIATYLYAVQNQELYVNLFMNSESQIETANGKVNFKQETNYPWDGKLNFTFLQANDVNLDLKVRIPGWVQNKAVPGDLYSIVNPESNEIEVMINGLAQKLAVNSGYVNIKGNWKDGDQVTVVLPMDVKIIRSNPNVEADKGKIAVQRGPLVYCAEGVDNGGNALNLSISSLSKWKTEFKPELLNGITTLQTVTKNKKVTPIKLIPYYAWSHRDLGEMAVWINESIK